MLEKVTNPSLGKITFGYDALGRRLWKESKGVRTCWLWDGNVPLHEWTETEAKPDIDLITWVFDEGGFTPVARLTETGSESIVTDYLGTPAMMFDADGKKTWSADLDIYGRVRTFAGRSLTSCPFRYQGQYQDAETGLYYNRFRYYDPGSGNYISQDPIGLLGDDLRLYSYVYDSNDGIDPFGLYNPYGNKKDGQFKKKPGRKPTLKPSVHGNAKLSTKPAVLYVMYDEQGNFQKWGITDKVNNPKVGRYGNSLPEGWTVEEMARGKRSDMLKLERELSEKLGGDLNKESWAKTKQGESLSPEADKIATKAGVHH
ncbi:MAG: RHS domain-containing protein [Tannerella sp.]|nr:RHS domain-containing protein [Tannerella sp.]